MADAASFDEIFWTKPQHGIAWPHVDDLATSSKEKWLNEKFKSMEIKFGKLTRETLPFQHCGCKYCKIPDGFRVDQAEYVKTLKNVDVPKDRVTTQSWTPTAPTCYGQPLAAVE